MPEIATSATAGARRSTTSLHVHAMQGHDISQRNRERLLRENHKAALASYTFRIGANTVVSGKAVAFSGQTALDDLEVPHGAEPVALVSAAGDHYDTFTVRHPRRFDAEAKLFNFLRDTIEQQPGTAPNAEVTGWIHLTPEIAMCDSCMAVVLQFRQHYPNVWVILFD